MASVIVEISGTHDLDTLIASEVIVTLVKIRCGIISVESKDKIVIKGERCASDIVGDDNK